MEVLKTLHNIRCMHACRCVYMQVSNILTLHGGHPQVANVLVSRIGHAGQTRERSWDQIYVLL